MNTIHRYTIKYRSRLFESGSKIAPVILVRGHYVSYLPLCSRNEPVFLAVCTPLAMPETRECVVHGATNVFTTVHAMDMKILHIDANSICSRKKKEVNLQHIIGSEDDETLYKTHLIASLKIKRLSFILSYQHELISQTHYTNMAAAVQTP
ncbi:hypothetical protein HF086_004278 [Spodoptera exigua]|uniref:Uncharacterized protein n=1 Tax=Spodoptera exigua TaxID=7107 RepID=A0A922MWZ7_SPOEX|nr:hypothetical protein HF086_004278 [Spodoptera exigua]